MPVIAVAMVGTIQQNIEFDNCDNWILFWTESRH